MTTNKFICVLVLLTLLAAWMLVGTGQEEAGYSFGLSTGDMIGTSKIRNVFDTFVTGNEAWCRGAMLALFGEPRYTTEDAENAYAYVLQADDGRGGAPILLTVYEGPSGAAIGGDASSNAARKAADALAALIQATTPADFEAVVYYGDTFSRITYGCEGGVPFYHEEQPVTPPWWIMDGEEDELDDGQ